MLSIKLLPHVQASEFEQDYDTESDVATKLTKQFKLSVINHSKKRCSMFVTMRI